MRRSSACCAILFLAFGAAAVSARTEYVLGGPDGNPWQAALSEEDAGEFVVFDEEGTLVRRVAVPTTPWGEGGDSVIEYDASPGSILPLFVRSDQNLALTDPDSPEIRIPLPATRGNAWTTDGCGAIDDQIRAVKKQFDGDVTTAHFRRFTPGTSIFSGGGRIIAGVTGEGWKNAVVLNFGAAVPVNRIRFFPRLSRVEDRLLIKEFQEPSHPLEEFGESSFAANFVEGYEIRVADDSQRFANSPCDAVGFSRGLRWIRTADTSLEILESRPENLERVVDLTFPTRSIRYMTFKTFPLRNWEVAEFQVFGEGYVEHTSFRTQILDFGGPSGGRVNWGKIRWSGEAPEGTRLEIRTRTGQTPDPNYYVAESVNGDIRRISTEEYLAIDATGRLDPRPDLDNWSFWSPPYTFEAGLRDSTVSAESWEDGTSLLSPGPSRYLQIDIQLFSTFTRASRIDQLGLQFSESPLAREVLGEIWPTEVTSFDATPFTYVVRPDFDDADLGFNRLEILTHNRVDPERLFLTVDGAPVDFDLHPPDLREDRLIFSFDELKGRSDRLKPIEATFEVPVLRYGAEFRGWVFHSDDPDRIRQQVRPGNATFRFGGNVLAVATPLKGGLLGDLTASGRTITPNGDGLNDELVLTYELRQLTVQRPVYLRIYDLGGRLVHVQEPRPGASGRGSQSWNARDGDGYLVPPGTYLYEVSLSTADAERRVGVVSVVY